jgi:hypothetical protein
MNQEPPTPTEKLEALLFQQARVQYCVGEPILTMREVPAAGGQKRRVPTRLWQLTVFAADESGQSIEGRSVDLFVYADTMPGVPILLELFLAYAEAIRQVWDARYARCCGFSTWDATYGSDYQYIEEAQARYQECKTIARRLRLLLGKRLFAAFRALDL